MWRKGLSCWIPSQRAVHMTLSIDLNFTIAPSDGRSRRRSASSRARWSGLLRNCLACSSRLHGSTQLLSMLGGAATC